MKKGFKLKRCTVGQPATIFWQDQLRELDFDFNAALTAAGPEEQIAFQRFAAAFGCFSRDKMLDANGKPTATVLGQLASALLRRLLQDDGTQAKQYRNARLRVGDFAQLVAQLPKDATPNQDFINYLRYNFRDGYGITRYPNLELLLDLERGYQKRNFEPQEDQLNVAVVEEIPPRPGIFAKVMSNFGLAQNLRTALNQQIVPTRLPYEEAFCLLYEKVPALEYQHVNGRNRALSDLFRSFNLTQDLFDFADTIYREAAKRHTPHHILKKPLAEAPGTHDFTFEMLDKYDPANAIIGMMGSCCAVLSNGFYGGAIAEIAITEPDVQNMVVRNGRHEIIAKGALYINTGKSEAVFNSLEINDAYRGSTPKMKKVQNEILAAFQRGTCAVAERYNQLHPKRPLQRVTVGTDFYRAEWLNLPVVEDRHRVMTNYNFNESNTGIQYLVYQAPSTQMQQTAQPGREW